MLAPERKSSVWRVLFHAIFTPERVFVWVALFIVLWKGGRAALKEVGGWAINVSKLVMDKSFLNIWNPVRIKVPNLKPTVFIYKVCLYLLIPVTFLIMQVLRRIYWKKKSALVNFFKSFEIHVWALFLFLNLAAFRETMPLLPPPDLPVISILCMKCDCEFPFS